MSASTLVEWHEERARRHSENAAVYLGDDAKQWQRDRAAFHAEAAATLRECEECLGQFVEGYDEDACTPDVHERARLVSNGRAALARLRGEGR